MMQAILGYLFLCALVLAAAGAAAVARALGRPRGEPTWRASDALRELEPRGGRQRFSVRLFEAAVLGALWVALTGAVVLLVPSAPALGGVGRLTAIVAPLTIAVATWWAWRRGALRSPRAPRLSGDDGGSEP